MRQRPAAGFRIAALVLTLRIQLARMLPRSRTLRTMYSMRLELAAFWNCSMATRDELVKPLEDWCRRAETSGIDKLRRFPRRLRSYASLGTS